MRTLGWVYLAGYALDAGLSVIASYVPDVMLASNVISTINLLFTTVAFVLACLGKLKPRKIFFLLTGYYFLVLGFGFAVGILLALQLGPQNLQGVDVNPQFLRQKFPWFEPLHLTLLFMWTCLAVYGLMSYAQTNVNVEHDSAADK